MPIVINNTLNQIRTTSAGNDDRTAKAKRLAEMIRKLGEYRWVGIYDVGPEFISICRMERPGRARISDISHQRRTKRRGNSVKANRDCRERTNGFPIPDDIPQHRF